MGRRRIDHETEMVTSIVGNGHTIVESRAARVLRLQAMVQGGHYRINPEELAETLLSRVGGVSEEVH